MTAHGRLIVFEGADAAGKSSIVAAVAAKAQTSIATAVDVLSFPGRTPGTLGAHVYALHHDPQKFGVERLPAASLQLLHVAAHLDAIESDIRPRVTAGNTVLLDRYWWSTWVYGVIGGVEREVLDAMISLERRYWGSLVPDAVILITRSAPLRADTPPDVFATLQAEYGSLANREEQRHRVIRVSNDGELSATVDTVVGMLNDRPAGGG
jgi:thymidylate kinase